MATLKVDLVVDDKGKAVISSFGGNLDKVMLSSKAKVADLGKALAISGAAFAGFATAGVAVMTKMVAAANAQEEAEVKLGAVLRATGQAAGYNLEQLKAMAGGLQQVTTVGDETILAGMSILATFKEIRGEGFERATKAALDMSTIMKTDLNSAIVQLGKALNDPAKGLTSLTRSGVSFTAQQQQQIKVLQESGRMMEAQNIILAEMESQFGGAAAAMRGTFAGAVESAKNAWGDLKEQIGFTITKNDEFIGAAQRVEQVFIGWGQAVEENRDAIATLFDAVITSAELAAKGIGAVTLAWVDLYNRSDAQAKGLPLNDALSMSTEQIKQWLREYELGISQLQLKLKEVSDEIAQIAKVRDFEQGEGIFGNWTEQAEASYQALIAEKTALENRIEVARQSAAVEAERVAAARDAGEQIKDVYEEVAAVALASETMVTLATEDAWVRKAQMAREYSATIAAETNAATNRQIAKLNGLERAKDAQVDSWVVKDRLAKETTIDNLEEIAEETTSTTSLMATEWGNFSNSVQTDFKNILSDFLFNEYDDIGDAFDDLLDRMLRSFVDMLIQMAIEWGKRKFLEYVFGVSSGGVGGSMAGGTGGSLTGPLGSAAGTYGMAKLTGVSTSTGLSGWQLAGSWLSNLGSSGAAGGNAAAAASYASGSITSGTASPAIIDAYAAVMTESLTSAAPVIGQNMGSAVSADLAASMTASTPTVSGGSTAGSTAAATAGAGGALAVGGSIAAFAISTFMGHLAKNVTYAEKLTGRGVRPDDFASGSGTWEDKQYWGASTPQKPVWDGTNESVVAHINALQTYKHALDELNPSLDMVNKASVNANGTFMVTATEIAKMGDGAEGTTLKFEAFSFDPITGAWESQTGLFNEMVAEMTSLSPATDAAIISTAQYVAEMHGLPDVADELVTAFRAAQGEVVSFGDTALDTGEKISGTNAQIAAMAGVSTQVTASTQNLNDTLASSGLSLDQFSGVVQNLALTAGAVESDIASVVRRINSMNVSGESSGSSPGYATGGVVNRLMVPSGDDGFAALSFGEGVIDRDTMTILSGAIRSGTLGAGDSDGVAKAIDELRREMTAISLSIARHSKRSSDALGRIEYLGIPESRRVAA